MRRLFVLLTALGLTSTLAGCQHVAGVCDCGNNGDHLFGTPISADAGLSIDTPAPPRVMPRVTTATTVTPSNNPSVGVASGIGAN
jgi:hypothetical protein